MAAKSKTRPTTPAPKEDPNVVDERTLSRDELLKYHHEYLVDKYKDFEDLLQMAAECNNMEDKHKRKEHREFDRMWNTKTATMALEHHGRHEGEHNFHEHHGKYPRDRTGWPITYNRKGDMVSVRDGSPVPQSDLALLR